MFADFARAGAQQNHEFDFQPRLAAIIAALEHMQIALTLDMTTVDRSQLLLRGE
jgi:hypothetical protein